MKRTIDFYTCRVCARKDMLNQTYSLDMPFGVSIQDVATVYGSDISYSISGNKVTGIDIPEGECIELRITLDVSDSIAGEFEIKGVWYGCGTKPDIKTYVLSEVPTTTTQVYPVYGWGTKPFATDGSNCFEVPIPEGCKIEDMCAYANGSLATGTWAIVDGMAKFTTDQTWGEPDDLCKITVKYMTSKMVGTLDGCYDKVVPKKYEELVVNTNEVKLTPAEGCVISEESVCVFVGGLLQSGATTACIAGDENCILITIPKSPNFDPEEECLVVIKYAEICKICPEVLIEEPQMDVVPPVDHIKVCKDGCEVLFEVCKTKDGNKYTGDSPQVVIEGTLEDLWNLGYSPNCDDENKTQIADFQKQIVDNQKLILDFEGDADTMEIAYVDPGECNYVRVTFMCPDGETAGCIALRPQMPMRKVCLSKKADNIIGLCFEVVEKDLGAELKDWVVVAPTEPIEVIVAAIDE